MKLILFLYALTNNGMDEQETLMKMFPQLIASSNFTKYKGFINAEGNDFQIFIQVPNYPSLSELTLRCSWNASVLLTNHDSLLKEWIQIGSLSTFLENLKNLLILQMKKKSIIPAYKEDGLAAESFKLLISDMSKIGFHNVVSFSSCLTKLQLKNVDSADRIHIINVNVGKIYPLEPVHIQATLPDEALEIINKSTSIDDVYKNFVQQIHHLQCIWNSLDLIDAQCCVLDPEHPTKKDLGRRILIEKNVSIYINMNFENVISMPTITILGPEQAVQQYQSALARNTELWNPDSSILDNLRAVLDLSSLAVKENNSSDISLIHGGECLICFTLWMDGEMPCQICDNSCCGGAFHSSCLFQWLQTVPGNYQSFNRLHGVCPNCGMPISCQVPK